METNTNQNFNLQHFQCQEILFLHFHSWLMLHFKRTKLQSFIL